MLTGKHRPRSPFVYPSLVNHHVTGFTTLIRWGLPVSANRGAGLPLLSPGVELFIYSAIDARLPWSIYHNNLPELHRGY
jgi:hypothetical protein